MWQIIATDALVKKTQSGVIGDRWSVQSYHKSGNKMGYKLSSGGPFSSRPN